MATTTAVPAWEAQMYQMGWDTLQKLLSGEYARYSSDRRIRDTVRQIAEMMYDATKNNADAVLDFLRPYFTLPEGVRPTAERLQEQRDLAKWIYELTGDLALAQQWVPTVQFTEPGAQQRWRDLDWNNWLRFQRERVIDPRTGQEVPLLQSALAQAINAGQMGQLAGLEADPFASNRQPAIQPPSVQPPAPAVASPAPATGTLNATYPLAENLLRGLTGYQLTPPGPQVGVPLANLMQQRGAGASATTPAANLAAPLAAQVPAAQSQGSLLDRLVNTVRDLIFRNLPSLDPQVEALFQAMKPELEAKYPDRLELRRILEATPLSELNEKFGSPALVRRIWNWVLSGQ